MNQFTASLWGDEAWAATLAVKPIFQIIKIVARDTSPPLYYLLLHYWMNIFGTSEVAIRTLSFLFFLGTVLTVYFIGKHLWDKRTGILAALLAFSNPFLFTYAFEGRMYSLLALTSTLSVYFFLKKHRLGFILATTVALYTHHFSLFVVIFEVIWRSKESWGKNLKQFIKSFSDFFIIGALYLPWVYPLYYQTSLVGSGFWLGKPTLNTLKETVQKFLVGSGEETLRQLSYWATIAILVSRNWFKEGKKTIFLLGWFFTPLILTFIISQFFQSIFFDRYLLMVIPASSLLIASLRRKVSFIFIFIVIFSLATLNYYYFSHPTKRPFRELATFIKQEAPNVPLINHNAAAHHLWESKYYGLEAPIYAPQPLPFYTGIALMEKEDVIEDLPNKKKLGVITSAPLEEVKIPGYHQVKYQQFGQLSFLWMEKEEKEIR
jgi:hypothetical protein